MQLFISDVLGRVATRLTSQVEIAVDNPTAEAEVEGGAAGLQGFPLCFFLWMGQILPLP